MNPRRFLTHWSLGLGTFFGLLYAVEIFIDSWVGVLLSKHSWAHVILFGAVYVIARGIAALGLLLWERDSLASEGFVFGGQLIRHWLFITLLLCVLLRFDLSHSAFTRALIIFLLPGDVVQDIPLLVRFVYSAGFWGVVIGGCALALTAVGIVLSLVLGGQKKQQKQPHDGG